MKDVGQFGQGELALGPGLNLVEAKPQQRLLGIGEVEEINLAGDVAGARDIERFLLFGQKLVLEHFEVAACLAAEEGPFREVHGQADLLRREPGVAGAFVGLCLRDQRRQLIPPKRQRDRAERPIQRWGQLHVCHEADAGIGHSRFVSELDGGFSRVDVGFYGFESRVFRQRGLEKLIGGQIERRGFEAGGQGRGGVCGAQPQGRLELRQQRPAGIFEVGHFVFEPLLFDLRAKDVL